MDLTSSTNDRLLLWMGVVLGISYLLPNHYLPWLSVHGELGAALAFAPLLLWAAFRAKSTPHLAVGAFMLSLVPIFQLLTGFLSFATDGLMGALYVLSFALAVHAGAFCHVDKNSSVKEQTAPLYWLAISLLMAALLSVGIQLYQWLMLGNQGIYVAELAPDSRPYANFAQQNQLATALLLGVFSLVLLFETRRLNAAVSLLAGLFLSVGLAMSGSRSVLLALTWFLTFYLLLWRRCKLRTSPLAVALVVGAYLLVSFAWKSINQMLLMSSDVSTAVDRLADLGSRKLMWASMVDAIERAPWAGYGWGQIGHAQTTVALDHPPTYFFFESAHNLFLDMALWSGLPVAIMFALGLLFWFGGQIYNCRDPVRFALLAGVAAVFSHAMVEFPLNYAYFLLPVGFWMGTLSAALPSSMRHYAFSSTSRFMFQKCVAAISCAAALVFTLVAYEYFPLEEDWRLLQFQDKRIGNLDPTEPPPAIILTGLREFLKFSRTSPEPGMSDAELLWMRRVYERYPYGASLFRYAQAQALNGRSEGAQQTLRRLCKMQMSSVCQSARNEWHLLSVGKYPQLKDIPFPN